MDPLEIIIRVVNDQAKAAMRDTAEAGRKAANDTIEGWRKAYADVLSGAKKAATEQEAESKRTTQQMINLLRSFGDQNIGVAERIRKGWETTNSSVAVNTAKAINKMNEEWSRHASSVMSLTPKIINATKEQADSVSYLGKVYAGLTIGREIAAGILSIWKATANAIKESRDALKSYYDTMSSHREASVELAFYKGQEPTSGFVASEARQAARLGLKPEQWREFQLHAYGSAAGYIGAAGEDMDKQQLEQAGRRVAEPEARKFFEATAPWLMGTMGIKADEASHIVGTAIAQAPVGATSQQLLSRFAPIMASVQQMKGMTGPQSAAVAQSLMELQRNPEDMQETMGMLGLASAAAEQNEKAIPTYMRAVDRLRHDIINNATKERLKTGTSRMDQLGITKQMTLPQAIGQFVKKQDEYLKAHPGASAADFVEEVASGSIAPGEIRQFYGIGGQLKGAARGTFQRVAETFRTTTADQVGQDFQKFIGGQIAREGAGKAQELAAMSEVSQGQEAMRQVERDVTEAAIKEMGLSENALDAILTGSDIQGRGRFEQIKHRLMAARINQFMQDHRDHPLAPPSVTGLQMPGRLGDVFGFGQTTGAGQLTAESTPQQFADQANIMAQIQRDMARTAKATEQRARQGQQQQNGPLPGRPPADGGARQAFDPFVRF